MQKELDFDVMEKYQVQYKKLKNFFDGLEYKVSFKEALFDFYFKTLIETIEKGKYTEKTVCSEIEDFIIDFGKWESFQARVNTCIDKYSHEMLDPKSAKIIFKRSHDYVNEDDNTYLECVITYRRKIEENEYDSVLDKIVMDHIKKEYYKEKFDFDQLKRKFEDEN